MEKVFFKKSLNNYYAKIIFGRKTYDGYIENISCEGAEYLLTCCIKVSKKFKPEKKAKIHFKLLSGETVNLSCSLMWFFISPSDNSKEVFGMEIINPPEQYKEFLKSLNTAYEFVEQEFIIDNVDCESESS